MATNSKRKIKTKEKNTLSATHINPPATTTILIIALTKENAEHYKRVDRLKTQNETDRAVNIRKDHSGTRVYTTQSHLRNILNSAFQHIMPWDTHRITDDMKPHSVIL